MHLLKFTSKIAFPVMLIGIVLTELGFASIGFKLFTGGGLAIAFIVGLLIVFSVGYDYRRY